MHQSAILTRRGVYLHPIITSFIDDNSRCVQRGRDETKEGRLNPMLQRFVKNQDQTNSHSPQNQQGKSEAVKRPMESRPQLSIKMQVAVNRTPAVDYIPTVSKWSSSTTSSTEKTTITTPEYYQQRLEENRQFFNNRPLMRALDTDDDQFLDEMLFENLLKDVKQKITNENANYRGQLQIIAFWNNLRMQLKDEEEDTSPLEDWPGWEKVIEATEVGIKES